MANFKTCFKFQNMLIQIYQNQVLPLSIFWSPYKVLPLTSCKF